MEDLAKTDETDFQIGGDLYGVSVMQLKARLILLQDEILRVNAELSKKEAEMSAAHNLFSRSP